jgi:hypothetical protein
MYRMQGGTALAHLCAGRFDEAAAILFHGLPQRIAAGVSGCRDGKAILAELHGVR